MFLLSFLPVFDISHLAKGSLPLWAWASAAFALWSTYRILWVEACLVFVTGSPSLFHRLAPLLLRLLQGRLLPLHTTGSAEQKSHIHETKCYLFHRITLQKQRQLSEAASTSPGTEAIWTKTGISGLLGDQMMSYYPPGNFCSCAYVCVNRSSVLRSEPAAHVINACCMSHLQLPNRTVWGGECPGWASRGSGVGCCQQPRPHQRRSKERIRLHCIMC